MLGDSGVTTSVLLMDCFKSPRGFDEKRVLVVMKVGERVVSRESVNSYSKHTALDAARCPFVHKLSIPDQLFLHKK